LNRWLFCVNLGSRAIGRRWGLCWLHPRGRLHGKCLDVKECTFEVERSISFGVHALGDTLERFESSILPSLYALPIYDFDLRASHARALLPAALASVSFGFVLVRVRVGDNEGGGASEKPAG